MCVVNVPEELKEFQHLHNLDECDEWGFISKDMSIGFRTKREDLNACPYKKMIVAAVDYICSIRRAMREQKLTDAEIAYCENEIEETKQDIIKLL